MSVEIKEVSLDDWLKKGKELFGEKMRFWKYVCPLCGFVQGGDDFIESGSSKETAESMAGFSCIGRILPKSRDVFAKGTGPCNYAGGGLLQFNPVKVTDENGQSERYFDFYRDEK